MYQLIGEMPDFESDIIAFLATQISSAIFSLNEEEVKSVVDNIICYC